MNPKVSTRFFLFLNTLLLSTTGILAQDGNFQKEMLKGSMKDMMKNMMNDYMKPQRSKNDSLNNSFEKETIKLEIDPTKIKIPIYSSFNHSKDSLKNKAWEQLAEETAKKEKHNISPYLLSPYTNEDLPFDYYYDSTLVFTDGKWIPKSALPGAGISPMTIIALLFASGIIKDDPLPPTKSRKEKALERLREIYGTGMDDKKWDGDVKKLNNAINKLREELGVGFGLGKEEGK